MKQHLFLLTFIACFSSAFSQNANWAFGLRGGVSADVAYDIEVDSAGNSYVGGNFQGTMDFDPGAGVANLTATGGGWDIFLAKYDPNGNYLWAITIPGVGGNDVINHIAIDNYGDCYVTGWFAGANVDFNPGPGSALLSSAGGDDIFVAKYTANGQYVWAHRIGGASADAGHGIAVDAAGNCYVSGKFLGANVDFDPGVGLANLSSAGGNDCFVAKYNTNGAYQWAFKIGGTANDIGWGVAVDVHSNVYVTGSFSGANINFNPQGASNLSSVGGDDIFVAKYTSAGNYLWALRAGGISSDIGFAIAVDITGNAYVSGTFQGANANFNSAGSALLSSAGGDDIFVAKYSATGAYQWAFKIGGVGSDNSWYKSTDIALDCADNVYVAGGFASINVDFDPGAGTALLSSAGSKDIFVAQYTTNGNYLCALKVGQSSEDDAYGIAVSQNGCHVAGRFQGTNMNFNPAGAAINLSSAVWSDVFVAKYNMCQAPPPTIASISGQQDVCPGNNLTLTASGGGLYTWYNGTTTASVTITPTAASTYSVIVTTGKWCKDTAYANINLLPPFALQVSPDAAVCVGNTTLLTAAGASAYTWTPALGLNNTTGNSVNASPTINTTYSVTGIDTNGCSGMASVVVNVNALPLISVSSNTIICTGSSATLTASGATSYLWLPAASLSANTGTPVIATPLSATTYTVTGTDNNGCSNTASITITLNTPLSGLVSQDTSLCIGNTAGLSAVASGGGATYFYNWQPGNIVGASINVSPTITTTYTVTIADNCGSTPHSEEVTVFVNALPVVTFISDNTSGCGPLCINFNNTTANTQNAFWNFGEGSTSINSNTQNCYTQEGSYAVSLVITDNNGCTDSLSIANYITVHPNPVAGFSYSPNEISIISPEVKFFDESIGASAWIWNFGDAMDNASNEQNPLFAYSDTGAFEVMQIVVNEFGCTDTAWQTLRIKPDFTIYIPNTFTPNGDAHNEIFIPMGIGIEIQQYNFYVLDRWGDLIFQSTNPSQGWDGRANGGASLAQQDTYVWKLELKDVLGKRHSYVGHVNLIR